MSAAPAEAAAKPIPTPSILAEPFWDALKRGEFVLQRCTACGHHNHPPKIICPKCHAQKLEWAAVARTGTLYSYTIVHRPPTAAFKADVPYAVGLVDVDGTGVRLLSSIVAPLDQVKVGMRLELVFDAVREDFTLFRFRPVAGA